MHIYTDTTSRILTWSELDIESCHVIPDHMITKLQMPMGLKE